MTLGTEAYLHEEVPAPHTSTEVGRESILRAHSRHSGRLPTYLAPGQLDLFMQPLSKEIQCKDRIGCCALAS